jgi:hypothetical protein
LSCSLTQSPPGAVGVQPAWVDHFPGVANGY